MAAVSTSQGATQEWNKSPGAGSGLWNTGSNWLSGNVPVAADTVFINNGGTSQINAPAGIKTASTLTIGNTAAQSGFLLVGGNGAGLTLTGNDSLVVGNAGTGEVTIQNNAVVTTSTRVRIGQASTGVGTVTVTGNNSSLRNLAGNFFVGDGGTGTISILSGGNLTTDSGARVGQQSTGRGTVILSGTGSTWNNTGSLRIGDEGRGTLTVSDGASLVTDGSIQLGFTATGQGTINIGSAPSDSAVAAGTITANNIVGGDDGEATVNFKHTNTDYVFGTRMSGTVTVNQRRGTTILTGENTYTGGTFITGGTLQIGNGGLAGSITGDISNDTQLIFNRSGGVLVYGGKITGSGALAVQGGGLIELAGANTYSGNTSVEAGTLRAGAANTFSSASNLTVSTGATVDLNDFNQDIKSLAGAGTIDLGTGTLKTGGAADTIFSGGITGTGGLIKQGSGKFTLSGEGLNTYSGETQINNGVLIAGYTNAFSANSRLNVTASGEVRLGGYDQVIASLSGSGTVKLSGNSSLNTGGDNTNSTFNGEITGVGKVIKAGSGTMTLTGTNDYTGSTRVAAGTLRGGSNNAFSAASAMIVDSTGTLDIGGTEQTVASLEGDGGVEINGGKLTSGDASNTEFAGLLSGSGEFIKIGAGRLVLSNANTFTGAVTINEGSVRATNERSLGMGTVNLNAGTLRATTPLTIQSMTWSGGTISMIAGNDITLEDTLTMTATGNISLSNALVNTKYEILSFDTLGSTTAGFTANPLSGLDAVFTISYDGGRTIVTLEYSGMSTGPTLSNSAPEFTPTNADFVVNGKVVTSDEANTVASLIFDANSALTVFNRLTVTTGNLTVDQGKASIDGTGVLIAPNGLTKLGQGLLDVLNDIIVNGNASVAAGQLAINGSLTAENVFVQLGAWLKGNGTIFGNVFNRGTVAPGNSPGTLTVVGNFVQAPSGNLQIEVASQSLFDRLIVSGQASLAGRLQILGYQGFNFKYGQQFSFLQADSISGEFDTITVPNPSKFRGRFIAEDGIGTIVIAPTSYTLVAETNNQKNVAKALNSFIGASGDRDVVSTALDLQTADQYPGSFDIISPAFFSSLPQISLEQMTAQNQFIAQRLSAVRLGINGFNAQGLNMPLTNDKDGKSVMEAKDAKTVITPANATKWALWVQGNGIFGRMTLTNLPTNRFAGGGFLGGADYRWSENFSTGIYSGYQGTYSKYSNGSSTTINSTLFGLYATYQQGGFYSDAIVGGAYNNYSNRRSIEFSTIDRTGRSNVDGGQLTAYLDAGYDWQVGKFTFGPLASLQYTYTGLGGFTESGAESLDLAVGQYNANSIRTNLGGRIAYTWNVTDKIIITPEVRMFWQHEYLNDQQSMSASLNGGAGPGFDYQPAAIGQDSVFAGAGANVQIGPNWNAYFYYNADFGRQDYVGQMISGGVNFKF